MKKEGGKDEGANAGRKKGKRGGKKKREGGMEEGEGGFRENSRIGIGQ